MIDTSVAAGGVVGINTNDVLGFLGTNKADKIFGMYRINGTLTYTFNIAGYTNLNLAVDMATTGNNPAGAKGFSIAYAIDGGATNTILNDGVNATGGWTEFMDNGTAVINSSSFTIFVNGAAAPYLTDEFQTYNPTISGTGSVLTLAIKMTSTVGGYGGYGLDNLKLYGTPRVVSGYYGWADMNGLSTSNSLPTENPDGDNLINFEEYAFGGDPANPDTGYVPTEAMVFSDGTNFLEYVYARRTTPNNGLTYRVETCSNLISNEWTTNGVVELPDNGIINDQFEAVTNRLPMNNNAGFLRLLVN
jgi:hypothetical protein